MEAISKKQNRYQEHKTFFQGDSPIGPSLQEELYYSVLERQQQIYLSVPMEP